MPPESLTSRDSQLVQLQQTAGNLLAVIAEVRDYNTLFGIQMVLAKEAPISGMPAMTPIAVQYPDLFRESVRYLLGLIQKNNIVYPSVENLSLGQFLDNLKVMTNLPATSKDDFKFNIPFREFSLTVQDWVNLIFRSRIILFMKSYMAQNAIQSGSIFFPNGENLIPIVMNPGNDGTLFFTGKATLDGRFTAEGFDQYVKPVLMELPDVMEKLPVRPKDVTEFSNFVYREVEAYAAALRLGI